MAKEDLFARAKGDPYIGFFNSQKCAPDHSQVANFVGLELNERCGSVYPNSKVQCFVELQTEGLCLRANHLASYLEANRQLIKNQTLFGMPADTPVTPVPCLIPATPTRSGRSQIGESLVSETAFVGEKSLIKRTTVGRNCKIGDKVKLTNCVLMDNVTIEEGANITGTIICQKATVGPNAEIKDCIIAPEQTVVALGKLSNEFVIDAGHLMEL